MSKGKWFVFSTSTGLIRGFPNLEYEYAPGETVKNTDGLPCLDYANFPEEFLSELRSHENTLFDLPKGMTFDFTKDYVKPMREKWWHG